MTEYLKDGRPRLPPNQVVTRKFPVMTAGTPVTAGKDAAAKDQDGGEGALNSHGFPRKFGD